MMRKLTVHVHLWFEDMAAESTDDARDAVKQALAAMHESCHAELSDALEAVGATDLKMETVVF